MRFNLIFCAIVVLVCVGCSTKHSGDSSLLPLQTIICDIDNASVVKTLSSICDSVSLIPLDSSGTEPMGIVDKVICDSTYIYMMCGNKLFVYDKQGHYFSSINAIGHANNEYVELGDFCITDSSIIIADTQNKKLLVFSRRGTFQRTIPLKQFPERIAMVNNSVLAISCSGIEGYRLIILDIERQKIIGKHFDYNKKYSYSIPQTFTESLGTLLYRQPLSNIYYSILDDGSIREKYDLNFGDYNLKESDLGVINWEGCDILLDTKGNADIINFSESVSLYQIEFSCNRIAEDAQFIMLINKKTQKSYLMSSNDYTDDLTYYDFRILPDFSYHYDGCFLGIIYPASWKDGIDEEKSIKTESIEQKKIYDYIDSLSYEQNPIVCLYHIKKSL